MLIRFFGALIRAILGAALWLAPTFFLPNAYSDAVFLTALLLFLFIFYEYLGTTPSFIEFRFAYGFNAFRFTLLCVLVAATCFVCLGDPRFTPVSDQLSVWLDFAGSPLRFMTVLAGDVGPEAAVAFTLSVTVSIIFCVLMTILPAFKRQRFNVWKNLPNVARSPIAMSRSGVLSILLGIALFYLLPFFLGVLAITPHTHAGVWGVVLWAFTPCMLILRGTALLKISRAFA